MREAVIVSTARTPLTKSHRGEFNIVPGPTLASFAVRAAVDRAGIEAVAVVLDCELQRGVGAVEHDADGGGVRRVLGDVGERLLHDPVNVNRHGGIERSPAAGALERHREPHLAIEVG